MKKPVKAIIKVQGTAVSILSEQQEDYICLTDIARFRNPDGTDDLIRNWLRNRNTVEFLGIWERLHNPAFNPVEFDGIRMLAGLNSFTLTPKQWIERTAAIGLISKAGRYGGTYAHKDIAFEFASWRISRASPSARCTSSPAALPDFWKPRRTHEPFFHR